MEFSKNLYEGIKRVCKEFNVSLASSTHHNALNKEIFWFEGNVRKRINFEIGSKTDIDVTFYKDTFPFSPKFFIFLHNYFSFNLHCKTDWKNLEGFVSLNEEPEYYYNKICSYIKSFKGS